ncbi:DUF4367 domain-containing protein [Paenibacillus sp. 1011MAR3C5]|uniref:DUF4367 domain-containing protein n=1 Tax=Paenibacillus sp. 1011MAR3C5 TaxID=1675787 RepID=UPI000E6D3936|nr:DUF4367 domain-containing protein [Paenibacillus sp. 1011MAR3C5]RJE85088.1 DUF4367 domain-containing protein [Paenibacillus sp. 1011MAR3C5]
MNKEEFDKLFDQAFEESVQNHKFTPDAGPSWEKLQLQLAKKKRRKSQLRALPYIAASFLLGAFLFGTPTASNAFQPLFKAVVTIKDDVVRIMFGENNASKTVPKTPPPPEDSSIVEYDDSNVVAVDEHYLSSNPQDLRFTTLEEASEKTNFPIPAITYIAKGYQLQEVIVFQNQEISRMAAISYTDDEGIAYTIILQRLLENSAFTSGGGPNIKMETLKIGTTETYIFSTNDGYIAQEFLIDDIHVSVSGPLSPEETLIISKEIIKNMTK